MLITIICGMVHRSANATEGITWGGQTYETADGKVAGTITTETIDVSQGFNISDTEVVMLTFTF